MYMKFLKPVSLNEENKFYNELNIDKPKNIINFNKNYILIVLDNIGGWYLSMDNYLLKLKLIINYIKLNVENNFKFKIRLHPKNREDTNLQTNIKNNFRNIEFDNSNIESHLGQCLCYFFLHSHLAYYYLYHGCLVFCFENNSLYKKYVLNEKHLFILNNLKSNTNNNVLKNYLMNRDKLFRILINQSIFYKNNYEERFAKKIFLYLNN